MRMNFENHTQAEHAKSIADYLPNNPVFESKNVPDTTLRNLLLGWATELVRDENTIVEIAEQDDIRQTTDLIVEWERMVGIPDDCFKADGSLADRRRDVIIKLGVALLTEKDYIDLGKLLGVEVKIRRLGECDVFPLPFPMPFCTQLPRSKFIMIIELPKRLLQCQFPVSFPMCFSSEKPSLIECIFRKLSAANVRLIFDYIL